MRNAKLSRYIDREREKREKALCVFLVYAFDVGIPLDSKLSLSLSQSKWKGSEVALAEVLGSGSPLNIKINKIMNR